METRNTPPKPGTPEYQGEWRWPYQVETPVAVPRSFTLVRYDDQMRPIPMAHGIALPGGGALTVRKDDGTAIGHWETPQSAANRLGGEIVWG